MSSQLSTNNPGRSVLRQPAASERLSDLSLSIIVLAIYCGFVLLVGYDRSLCC